jgi:hypothetical protein
MSSQPGLGTTAHWVPGGEEKKKVKKNCRILNLRLNQHQINFETEKETEPKTE